MELCLLVILNTCFSGVEKEIIVIHLVLRKNNNSLNYLKYLNLEKTSSS